MGHIEETWYKILLSAMGSATLSEIASQGRLSNWQRLRRHVELLVKASFLVRSRSVPNGPVKYSLTPKGEQFKNLLACLIWARKTLEL